MGCQVPSALDEAPPRWQVGASWAGFDTDLAFVDGATARLRQHAVSVSATRLLPSDWSLRLAAGGTLGGDLDDGNTVETLGPGWQAAFQAARRWRTAEGAAPFVSTHLALAAGGTPLPDGSLLATDLRLGATAGWQVGSAWSPYLALQVFGGPMWRTTDGVSVQGSDLHHYRPSVGSTFFLPAGFSLFVDGAPVGETGLAGGVAWAG